MAGAGLAVAPIAGFYAPGPGGPLPIIAQDGRTPAQAYARPFDANGRPKVALVIGGLGLNARATRQAIETLRPEITLSFVPLRRGPAGLDRHGPRPRPRGAARGADGAGGLSGQRPRPLHPDGRRASRPRP